MVEEEGAARAGVVVSTTVAAVELSPFAAFASATSAVPSAFVVFAAGAVAAAVGALLRLETLGAGAGVAFSEAVEALVVLERDRVKTIVEGVL
jgi:hypothetical protein